MASTNADNSFSEGYITIKFVPFYLSDCSEVIMMTEDKTDVSEIRQKYSKMNNKDINALAFAYFGKVVQSGTLKENGITEGCEIHVVPSEKLELL